MKNGWIAWPNEPALLAVGDLVEADLERGEDEQDQPDLGVGARASGGRGRAPAARCVGSHRPVLT